MVTIDQREVLLREFNQVNNELVQLLSDLDEEKLNKVPFEGSWTAGQVGEHLAMVHKGFNKLLNGPTKSTERSADEKVDGLKAVFSDFSFKMTAPEIVVPKKTDHHKAELIDSLNSINGAIRESIEKLELSETCMAFEVPRSGYVTRLEAAWFIILHTQRHVHQLRNIVQKLK